MLIEAGFDVAFECPATTPMILLLSIHPSRDADLLTPDRIVSDPSLLMRSYLDLFGNRLRASKFRRGSSRSPIASSFRTRASRTKHHPTCGRRRSSTFPTRRCCSCSRAAIATATSSPISPGRSSESCPAPCVCRRSKISFMRRSALVIPTRAQLVAPAIPCTKASASAGTSPISPSRSAAA